MALAGVLAAATGMVPTAASPAGTAAAATLPDRPTAPASKAARKATATDFTVASFNVLGSSHTSGSGRYAGGVRRTGNVVRLLDRHGVEVVGFQEMQAPQLASFLRRTKGRYEVYPGFRLRRVDTENSIAWDTTVWEPVKRRTVDIPYFDGRPRPMPVVKLRNLRTGMTAWFGNFHNPATNANHPGQDRWRRLAIRREVALARRLHRTGVPVLLTGDMNEREKVFCPMTGQAPMQAARGGSHRHGVCDAKDPRYVDWVFGSRKLTFHDYVEDRGALVRRTSDHPMIVSEARIDLLEYRDAVMLRPLS